LTDILHCLKVATASGWADDFNLGDIDDGADLSQTFWGGRRSFSSIEVSSH